MSNLSLQEFDQNSVNIVPFQFNTQEIRVTLIDGNPWFIGKDVCNVLEVKDSSTAYSRLKGYEKLTRLITVSGQNREMVVISESGLYRLVLTSRKPQSEPFQDWVVQEVLPSIRKTGSYSVLRSTEKLKCQVAQLTKDNERLRKNCLNSTLASVGMINGLRETQESLLELVEIQKDKIAELTLEILCLKDSSKIQSDKIAKLYSRVALLEQRLQDYESIGLAFSELTAKCQAERTEANKYKNLI
jgi:prophage antirepressor-like protein